MADLIDRQAALDVIDSWRREYPLDLQEPIDDCWNAVRELPAVQPDHNANVSKKVSISCGQENDLISRQAALDCFCDWIDRYGNEHTADEDATYQRIAELKCVEGCDDAISRQAALDAIMSDKIDDNTLNIMIALGSGKEAKTLNDACDRHASLLNDLPSVQPDRDVIDDCLYHIYKNISVHTATGGVIAIKHYMQVLYEEIYGEGERPWWMT